MSSIRNALGVCRCSSQSVSSCGSSTRRLSLGQWRRWQSTSQAPAGHDGRGEAFDKLISSFEEKDSDQHWPSAVQSESSNPPNTLENKPKWTKKVHNQGSKDKPTRIGKPYDNKPKWLKDSHDESLKAKPTWPQTVPHNREINTPAASESPDVSKSIPPISPQQNSAESTSTAQNNNTKPNGNKKDVLRAVYKDNQVKIKLKGRTNVFDPLFLRDSCTCPKCVDQSTRQKLFSTTDIPSHIQPKDMWADGDVLNITWTDDLPNFDPDHVTSLQYNFLRRSTIKRPVSQFRTGKIVWNVDDFVTSKTTFDYQDYMSNDRTLFEVLNQLHRYGLVFLSNVPEAVPSVSDIATRIGPLKSTFYGSTWDVRSVSEAKNVAYTSQDLGFHMDLLYMHQPPRLQFLHCLKASDVGGTSLFSDSYKAVEHMFKQNMSSFNILADNDVNFHYDNDSQHYHQSRRVIQLPPNAVREGKSVQSILDAVNWSPPFQGPFHNIEGSHALMVHTRRWHKAARDFRDLVESKSAVYRRQMPPGECVIFDNRRVLHARTAFAGGERWLRGTYLDSDPFMSKLRVLGRRFGVSTKKSQTTSEVEI